MLFCSLLMAGMLPHRPVQGHRVNGLTAVWPYADLVVRSDFMIKKSDAELASEKVALTKNVPVFLELRVSERDAKLARLERLMQTEPLAYSELRLLLDSVYRRGVAESYPLAGETQRPLYVVNGNFAQPGNYSDFFTIRSAADFIERHLNNPLAKAHYTDFLTITHFADPLRSEQYLASRLSQLSLYREVLRSGEIIVRRGEPLTEAKRQLINRYFDDQNQRTGFEPLHYLARWIISLILLLVLLVFLAFFRRLIFGQNKQVVFIFLVVLTSVATVYFFQRVGLTVYALPFALVPILIRVFFDARTALFTHLIVVLACAFFMPDKLEFILLQLVTGIATLFSVAEMRKRQQILNAAALVFLFYVILFVAWHLGFGTPQLLRHAGSYFYFALSALLVLLAYPLIFITERFFGFISDFRLLELCDLNQPLLRRLSQDVPGTFQHSLQVANLAEEAIYHIGGNALLARAGAMYHDIGKMENPNFFTENQLSGFNPHQDLEPVESARIIISHVIKGIELAKQYQLPEQVIDFIRTHHGTTAVGYFLQLSKMQNAGEVVPDAEFRYPGPIPFSKETAVLMIADGVEAASRSLRAHDAVAINELVDKIIDYKIAQNQFLNSDITFRDITTIKKIFKKRLMNIYHARIEYPS